MWEGMLCWTLMHFGDCFFWFFLFLASDMVVVRSCLSYSSVIMPPELAQGLSVGGRLSVLHTPSALVDHVVLYSRSAEQLESALLSHQGMSEGWAPKSGLQI